MPTVKELKAALDELGADYDSDALKADLAKLLAEASASVDSSDSSDENEESMESDSTGSDEGPDGIDDIVVHARSIHGDDTRGVEIEVRELARRAGIDVPDSLF